MAIIECKGLDSVESIFINQIDDYFTTASRDIAAYMGENMTEDRRNKINAEINQLVERVKNVYIPFRRDCDNQHEACSGLATGFAIYAEPLVRSLYEDPCKYTTLGVFIIAGSLYILMLQELIVEDPQEKAIPFNLPHYVELVHFSKTYANHVENCYKEIVAARMGVITDVTFMAETNKLMGTNTIFFLTSWKDNVKNSNCEKADVTVQISSNNYSNGKPADLFNGACLARQSYIIAIKENLQEVLYNPMLVKMAWKDCATKCLPKSKWWKEDEEIESEDDTAAGASELPSKKRKNE
ncbi:hypothetical protein EB796_010978 [Bugula neritina]|uniref:Uncharacterized protein n=1 Tax=Bugula neritina TaxID=10212 RepID=A0A7J7JXM0_BUGNE|nr:hypothetical protein EB796_010978 [Bugula neritina]